MHKIAQTIIRSSILTLVEGYQHLACPTPKARTMQRIQQNSSPKTRPHNQIEDHYIKFQPNLNTSSQHLHLAIYSNKQTPQCDYIATLYAGAASRYCQPFPIPVRKPFTSQFASQIQFPHLTNHGSKTNFTSTPLPPSLSSFSFYPCSDSPRLWSWSFPRIFLGLKDFSYGERLDRLGLILLEWVRGN